MLSCRTGIEAVRAKDAARLVSHHAPDVVAYDLLEPLQYKGAADLRQRAQQWLDGYDGAMTYEIRDLVVVPGHGVAFCHGLHHVAGRLRTARRSTCGGVPRRACTGRRQVADRPRAQLAAVRHGDRQGLVRSQALSRQVMKATFSMRKIDIRRRKDAYEAR